MFIHENDDGSVVWTGSFHKPTWDAYWHGRGELAPAAGGFPAEAAPETDDHGEAGASAPADPPDGPEAPPEPPQDPPAKKTAKKAAKKTTAPSTKDGDD